ncbi:MAG: tetratricopeptide repeat protein [Candidatus Aureabacteria bacterium]|nr:tetratricopeptide repeat protein [Candidatus Auribacterota bacterium]
MRKVVTIIALVMLVCVAYANIPGNFFTNWDDEHLIVKNKGIRSLDLLFMLANFHISYPPLTVFSHALDHLYWGFNPIGYHLTDIMLYALSVLTFFYICLGLLRDSRAGFLAAAIFLLHPLHVESVAWLSSRKDGLGMLFYLLAFLSYIRFSRSGGARFIWLSALFYLCALWAKPFTVTLPLALVLYDLLLGPRRSRVAESIRNKLPYVLPLLITALATVFLDPHNETSLPYHGGSAFMTFLAVLKVMGDYLRMLLIPVRLNSLYVVSLPSRLGEMSCVFPLLIWLALLAGALAARKRSPIFSFCTLWAVLSLLPVLQIIPTNVVKADRYLYLPVAALSLLAGSWMSGRRSAFVGRGTILAITAMITCLMLLTISRNTVWGSSFSLWKSVLARNPSNADAYNNLSIAYARIGMYQDAEDAARKALELRPNFASAHNNLANVYRLTGRNDEALVELQKAMDLTKDIVYAASVYIGMGLIYEQRGEFGKALDAYGKASQLSPAYLDDSVIIRHRELCRQKLRKQNRLLE